MTARRRTIDARDGAQRYARSLGAGRRAGGFVPMTRPRLERLLHAQPSVLARGAARRAVQRRRRRTRSGAALVEAHLTEPDVLDCSIARSAATSSPRSCPGWPPSEAVERVARAAGRAGRRVRAGAARPDPRRAGADQPLGVRPRATRSSRRCATARRGSGRCSAGAAIGIGIADIDGQILDVNQAFADMLGYTRRGDARRCNVARARPPRRRRRACGGCTSELIAGKRDHYRVEKRYYRKDGAPVWTDLTVSLIRDDDGEPRYTVAMVEDITDRHQLQERLRYQALHDPLTGLPNRTLFFERLAACFADARPSTPGRRLLPRPRRLQGDQRHASATTSATGCWSRSPAARRLRGRRGPPGGPDGRRRVRDPGRGLAPAPSDAVAVAERVLAAVAEPVRVGGHQLARLGQHRHRRAPGRRHQRRRADAGRRHHAVLGQGRRPGPLGAASTRSATPARWPGPRSSAALPAALERGEFYVEYQPLVRARRRRRARRRGAGPLAAPGARACSARTGSSGWPRRPALIVPLGRWVLQPGVRAGRRVARASSRRGPADRQRQPGRAPGRATRSWSTTSPMLRRDRAAAATCCSWS